MPIEVAAFYRFVAIEDPASLKHALATLACGRGITGTILIAREGINGTIAGSADGIAAVIEAMSADRRFTGLDVKRSTASSPPFKRLKVKVKREIVMFGAPAADPASRTGTRVAPPDWNALIADPGITLIDTRNAYEVAIGSFPGAIDPQTSSFGEFKSFVANRLDPLTHRRIAMFCTGGIRCEKASSYLLSLGFAEVYQLDGGILRYLEEMPSADSAWRGECYVFDDRVAVRDGVREGTHRMCQACGAPVLRVDPACRCGQLTPERRDPT
jgi:UPF0176 protein